MAFALIVGEVGPDGRPIFEALLHPTGEFAARFLILAMVITPLRTMFPKAGWLLWLMRRRRYLGVAAFAYALAQTVLYIVDIGALRLILAETTALAIWTGWVAFAHFAVLAAISNDMSQRALLVWWKRLQRLVYPAAVLTLIHWIFIHNNLGPALVHFVPLALLEIFRIRKAVGANGRPIPNDAGHIN